MRGRRDLIAERASVGIRLHPSCGQQSVAFMQNERQEGSVPADLLCGRDGVVCVGGFVVSLVFVGPRPKSRRVAAGFLGAGS
jgi:hypothetical protein